MDSKDETAWPYASDDFAYCDPPRIEFVHRIRSMLPNTHTTRLLDAGFYTLLGLQSEQRQGTARRLVRDHIMARARISEDHQEVPGAVATSPLSVSAIGANTDRLAGALSSDERDRARTRAQRASRGEFEFLNKRRWIPIQGAGRAEVADVDTLWQLKLDGFEPLAWLVLSCTPERCARMIRGYGRWLFAWIRTTSPNSPGSLRGAWTPWAVSRRVMNWCRFAAWLGPDWGSHIGPLAMGTFRRELYRNASFLADHLEYDVGGNHLIENGAALLIAGIAFDHEGWISQGRDLLEETARRQFLDDGCHFERSPMYHLIVTTRLLTAIDLLETSNRDVPETMRETATKAVTFLAVLETPDEDFPLVNDAVGGQSLSIATCRRYARTIGITPGTRTTRRAGDERQTSGYRWLENEVGSMFVDGGAIGPRHLPGHGHVDTLSIQLWTDGVHVLTDTGTPPYTAGDDRIYARGIRAHNSVQVGDSDPVTVGGKYLLGPRCEPAARYTQGHITRWEGCYRAVPLGNPTYIHHRVVYAGPTWWLLRDRVRARRPRPLTLRFHTHPAMEVRETDSGMAVVERDDPDTRRCQILPAQDASSQLRTTPYFPEFGASRERDTVEQTIPRSYARDGTVDTLLLSGERRVDDWAVESDSDSTVLTVNNQSFELPTPNTTIPELGEPLHAPVTQRM